MKLSECRKPLLLEAADWRNILNCAQCGVFTMVSDLEKCGNTLYCEACLEVVTAVCDACGCRKPMDDLVEFSDICYCHSCLDELTFECGHCGARVTKEDATEFDGQQYCGTCLDELTHVCERCGQRVPADETYTVEDDELCEDCADAHSVTCNCCDDRVYETSTQMIDDEYVCDNCVSNDDSIYYCYNCGEPHFEGNIRYHEHTGHDYCDECYPSDGPIHGYHDGPPLVFFGSGKYYIGVELEVDGDSCYDRDESADKAIRIMNDHVYCENDSSLENGFEIITHPHTYEELQRLPWERLFQMLLQDEWRGHDTKTAGLHVHIGRGCFDDESAIDRFCTFFENNWKFAVAFSRRRQSQINNYAARYFVEEESPGKRYSTREVKEQAGGGHSRYKAVNLTNRDTVEVRIFRSTLKVSTFLAALEFTYLLAEKCNHVTDAEAENMSIHQWLCDASENLRAYCELRGWPLHTEHTQQEAA